MSPVQPASLVPARFALTTSGGDVRLHTAQGPLFALPRGMHISSLGSTWLSSAGCGPPTIRAGPYLVAARVSEAHVGALALDMKRMPHAARLALVWLARALGGGANSGGSGGDANAAGIVAQGGAVMKNATLLVVAEALEKSAVLEQQAALEETTTLEFVCSSSETDVNGAGDTTTVRSRLWLGIIAPHGSAQSPCTERDAPAHHGSSPHHLPSAR